MRIEPLGEAAFILRDLPRPAYLVAKHLEAQNLPGLIEAVASYDTVGVYIDPSVFREATLAALDLAAVPEASEPRRHRIPVCYAMGEDLEAAAAELGLSVPELVREHADREYLCSAIGFCPGFAYLGPLADRLSGLSRRDHPRIRVHAGSVAITGLQTGIYPMERPGGWWLIGRTPLTLVDVAEDYFPIRAGDRVRFFHIDEAEFERQKGARL
jgi:inhibitor of KinA